MVQRILALDTATEACSAALAVGDAVLADSVISPRGHTARVLPMVKALLAEAGISLAALDGLAWGCGPGSFTGLRIGTSVVQGLALSHDLPVAPVSNLEMLAQGGWRAVGAARVVAALDARMGEVYWAGYEIGEDGLMHPVARARVCAPEATPCVVRGEGWWGVGRGWGAYGDALARQQGELAGTLPEAVPLARDALARARQVLRDGEGVSAEQAQPVYLRNRVAEKPRA
ncbi:tRNA (adenosine(37)-N6)-threonylcarbamoyltransferase complex dimerization subunit type 1 TsaB [Alkalilimnicola ehrlichii MLHE-1]|uniref:tRNA threonylcarbamoyladenosine biosynthesis protein TsaB n=1 Tax=Alkalilimnicola ehrlichii (strain ATCC BAA-1101 / DSM 17681 / MLHE-1) TaxID=187272 RepID=Q0A9E5_ALKEH|nr:tRNA (adenosine(37)-N6)-threonylcarbamoyltransferase complex dimerization subunit type 1 TsaB [Alkalilimnicola ehrlichii]ABI56542.1 peptidase M22, glycoprotease [Alkalilimnicola ehrlichii MLHE-1]